MSGRTGDPVNLLLVDDHDENLLALEAILSADDYRVVRARSGREALKCALDNDFALILLDVAMPDMDGYETATLIRGRERSRETPIIFLTANYVTDLHVSRGYAVGAVDYIFKPFSPEILRYKVGVFVELFLKREAMKRHTIELRQAHDALEERVRTRTEELSHTNEVLRTEIVERLRIERERAELLDREQEARVYAERINRMKDEFLATLSHELRTPLNAILGWAQILETGALDARAQRAVTVIRNNAVAQSQLIDDILDVSRIIGGKLRLNLGHADLMEILDGALDSVAHAAQAKNIQIELECEDIAPIWADKARLQQVVWNLLCNAVKFTPKDGTVTIGVRRADQDVVLSFADTGIGIDAQFLPYVFDRFSQADSTSTRRHGGLGLGLAIVRHLVELHGGTVRAASRGENQGATFTAVVPIQVPADDDLPVETLPPLVHNPSLPKALASLKGLTILVVDDDIDSGEFLGTILEEQGASVSLARSAAQALEIFDRMRPDLIVSDLAMPGEDGYSLIRRVRALPLGRQTPAVAVSAHVRPEDAAAALVAGFNRHVAKPVVTAEIIAAIAELTADQKSG